MATGPAFDGAAKLAGVYRQLSVGCHILLVDGNSLQPASEIPSLVSSHGNKLRKSVVDFAIAALRGRIGARDVVTEACAQIAKLQSAGVSVTHVDSHKHTHMFPAVFEPLLRAARECGVRAVRNPFVPLKPLAFSHLVKQPKLWTRYSEVRLLRCFAQQFRKSCADLGMITTDGSIGIVATGRLKARLFQAILASVPAGTWEFVCHPGYSDSELERANTRLRRSREVELELLTCPETKALLTKYSILLTSYRELTDEARAN